MNMCRRFGPLVLVLASLLFVASGCGDDPATKAQFLDHAVDIAKAAKTPEQKASMRRIFECVWPDISKDEDLLADFMAASEPNATLSGEVSKLMAPCLGAGSPVTTTAPSTTPP